jgi:hypothetical protein
MARSFAITTAINENLHADEQGHAQAVYTVTNSTSRPIRGLAKVKALGDTKRDWLDIEGETERDFAAGATQQFTVNFDARGETAASGSATAPNASPPPTPTAGKVKPGKYAFRLDVASAMSSDEDFTEGPVITVEVEGVAEPAKKSFPIWVIPVVAVVLIAIGITAWLLLRTNTVVVPNVIGMKVYDAASTLEAKKLKANIRETKVTGKVEPGTVSSQMPEAGTEQVPEGSTVDLVVEAEKPQPTGGRPPAIKIPGKR